MPAEDDVPEWTNQAALHLAVEKHFQELPLSNLPTTST